MVTAHSLEEETSALTTAGYSPNVLPDGSFILQEPEAINAPHLIASLLVHAGAPPSRLYVDEEALEDYFLRMVGVEAEVSHA